MKRLETTVRKKQAFRTRRLAHCVKRGFVRKIVVELLRVIIPQNIKACVLWYGTYQCF